MESPEHIFRDFLRQRHLKYTTERIAILNTIQKFGRPFEAEELLLLLREADHRISKATVYRTLKHLLNAGLIKQVHFGLGGGVPGGAGLTWGGGGGGGGKQLHYDFVDPSQGAASPGREGHDHLLDVETGKIIPFSSELVVKLRDEIAASMGFTAVSHRFQIIARRNS